MIWQSGDVTSASLELDTLITVAAGGAGGAGDAKLKQLSISETDDAALAWREAEEVSTMSVTGRGTDVDVSDGWRRLAGCSLLSGDVIVLYAVGDGD